MSDAILTVESLSVRFALRRGLFGRAGGEVRAVDGVSFSVGEGEVLALVGESGCGKSTLARAVTGLVPEATGRVSFRGQDVLSASSEARRSLRRQVQLVFQDPAGSLDPRMTAEELVGEAFDIHGLDPGRTRREVVASLLECVGLRPDQLDRYPHEFSGGQRQRIGIARALAVRPSLLVLDEPVSALDVSIQAQVLNLLDELRATLGLSYLFISHDLRVVRHVADRIAVMYLGRIVELAPAEALLASPQHPYASILLSAVPSLDPASRRERLLPEGEVPSPLDPPRGCAFHPRCPIAIERCRTERPPLAALEGMAGREVACFRPGEPIVPLRTPPVP